MDQVAIQARMHRFALVYSGEFMDEGRGKR